MRALQGFGTGGKFTLPARLGTKKNPGWKSGFFFRRLLLRGNASHAAQSVTAQGELRTRNLDFEAD
jgi:hypothetical protein